MLRVFIFLFSIHLLAPQISLSQHIVTHKHFIENIVADAHGQIWIKDINGDFFELSNGKLHKTDWSDPEFKVWKSQRNALIISSGSSLFMLAQKELKLLYKAESDIAYACGLQEGILIHSGDKIIYLDSGIERTCDYNSDHYEKILAAAMIEDNLMVLNKQQLQDICREPDMSFSNGFLYSDMSRQDDNTLLISTCSEGLWVFSNNSIKQFYQAGITLPRKIKSIRNSKDELWIIDSTNVLHHFDWHRQTIEKVDRDVRDFCTDRWNTVWYTQDNRIFKNTRFSNRELPLITVSKIEVGYKEIKDVTRISSQEAGGGIAIYYDMSYSPNQESLQCYYSLDMGGTWKLHQEGGPILLRNISAGNHSVSIKASADEVYFSNATTVKFSVVQEFMKSIWFYVFLALAILLSIAVISLWIHNFNKRKWNAEKDKIKLELDLLKQKQKLGQLQLNPHFLFNTLNSISGLIALEETKNARKYLNEFSQMMRSLLEQSIQDDINVEDEVKFLSQYLALEQMIYNHKFDFQISCESSKDRRIPIMVVQPFVENAIIHGIIPQAEKGFIEISFADSDKYIHVKITDNGIGREKAAADKNPGHRSSAIRITEERLRNLDKWSNTPHIVYEDLKDDQNNVSGTIVSLYIPCK